MIHTYENAVQIREAYKYLVGKYTPLESDITDICIIPADLRHLAHFLLHYKEKSAEESLQLAGFDPYQVRIVVIHEQTLSTPAYMIDLDVYLESRGIKKSYDEFTKKFVVLN